MKTFYITNGAKAVVIDSERNEASDPKTLFTHIRDMFVAEEPLEIRSTTKNGKQVITKAEKGDIILTFYSHSLDEDGISRDPIVIKNAEWKKRVREEIAKEAARKEEFRVKANLSCDDECCEKCC